MDFTESFVDTLALFSLILMRLVGSSLDLAYHFLSNKRATCGIILQGRWAIDVWFASQGLLQGSNPESRKILHSSHVSSISAHVRSICAWEMSGRSHPTLKSYSCIGATEATEVTERDESLTRLLIRANVYRRREAGIVFS